LSVNQLQQAKLEVEALLLFVSQVGMGAQHDLQEACEIFFAETLGDARDSRSLVGRNLQDGRITACNLGHHGVAQEADHLAGKVLRALSLNKQAIDGA